MDKPFNELDRHFALPEVAPVEATRPLRWLRAGWADLAASPLASLAYGAGFAVLGYLILAYAADMPHLLTAAISGFVLIGPLAAAGLYEISRRHEANQRTGLLQSLGALRRHADSLMYFGIMLAVMMILWERVSAMMFALFYQDDIPDLASLYSRVVLSGEYVDFLLAYVVVGGAIAATVYALTAVAVPMLMDRDTDVVTAMMASLRAIGTNPAAMALWAAIIVALVAIGFATMMVGMIVLLPLLGHATWHAYRDLVR